MVLAAEISLAIIAIGTGLLAIFLYAGWQMIGEPINSVPVVVPA
jgi:hypothetical protein